MRSKLRLDAVLVQAVIAGALSFSHLHDLAAAAGQDGWKAWAYPVSVDLLFVAAWRRLRTLRAGHHAARAAWTWFVIALVASLGANVATAGLLDLHHVPAWLRILVAGWPALAFLGGTLLAHAPAQPVQADTTTETAPASEPVTVERAPDPQQAELPAPASEKVPEAVEEPSPETVPAAPSPRPAVPAPAVPPALLDHARKIADTHHVTTGAPMAPDALRARLGLPAPMADAIAVELQLA
ncbi:DUF2637 domain-containing protein [Streptomyces sp. NPDC048248]|uniref:DUF2637 domain-containing protein n=1 Tax=Streptomyces sp. NPDC048248 TaxID=3365523 RepID=UPI00371278B4